MVPVPWVEEWRSVDCSAAVLWVERAHTVRCSGRHDGWKVWQRAARCPRISHVPCSSERADAHLIMLRCAGYIQATTRCRNSRRAAQLPVCLLGEVQLHVPSSSNQSLAGWTRWYFFSQHNCSTAPQLLRNCNAYSSTCPEPGVSLLLHNRHTLSTLLSTGDRERQPT